jgi:hypothetical protein
MKPRITLVLLLFALSPVRASAQIPAGGEFQVNTYTTGHQHWTSVSSDGSGNFVVAWESKDQDGSGYGVFGQRLDASGDRRGAEFRVNTYTTDNQRLPSVATDVHGNFVVAWEAKGQDGSGYGVFAQRYDASGSPRGSEFRVNTWTTSDQTNPSAASDAQGNFVVTWSNFDPNARGIFSQRYDASGAPRGAEFQVTSVFATSGVVSSDPAGNFVVAWTGSSLRLFARRYDASGAPRGAEFRVSTDTGGLDFESVAGLAMDAQGNFVVVWTLWQYIQPYSLTGRGPTGSGNAVYGKQYAASGQERGPQFEVTPESAPAAVASDAAGDFVVTWRAYYAGNAGVSGQRYDASGSPRGSTFQVNTFTGSVRAPSVASDPAGNALVAWHSYTQDGSGNGVFGRRFGGIVPAALAVDGAASSGSDGNGVLEPGETVDVKPSWRNVNGTAQTFDGGGLSFTGPAASGVSYSPLDGIGAYGTVADGSTAACTDCYRVGLGFGGTRPSLHWDATLTERLTPDGLGQTKPWSIHVGESFADVPRTSAYYRDIETLLHKGVTGGCTATAYCPADAVTREQMSVFTLEARQGTGYRPPACGATPMFADVPTSSFFCGWIEELARRGVVGGCGGSNYCPGAAVTREQLPVFVLRLLDPSLNPPVCGTPMFLDVPASSPFCRWIEELARRGVVGGCGDGNYCPTSPVTREQMAVFITGTYRLSLYGP